MNEVKMEWYSSDKILIEHENLLYKQVYCWIISKNNLLPLVSKDNKYWQFPGGHPEKNETILETCYREIKEETGLNLEHTIPKFFGYYRVEEFNPTINKMDVYLQLRLFTKLDKFSTELELNVNEKIDEERKVFYTKWFTLIDLINTVPWVENSEEFNTFKKRIFI